MSCLLDEVKNDLQCAVENLCELFEDFEFCSKCGSYTQETITDIEDYSNFIDASSGELDFEEFKKIIKNLTPIVDDVKKSDFDWDELKDRFDNVSKNYKNYTNITEELENNDLNEDETEVLTKFDTEYGLFELALSKGWIIAVDINNEEAFIINKDLKDLGFTV